MEQELVKWCEFERRITMLEMNLQQLVNQTLQMNKDVLTRFDNAAKTFDETSNRLTQLESRRV